MKVMVMLFFVMITSVYYLQNPLMQDYFTDEEISIANTSSTAEYHTQEEKNMVTWLNLARMNPTKFYKVVEYYSNVKYGSKYKSNSYVRSLLATLKKMKPIGALQPDEKMQELAFCWAKEAGVKGLIGHKRKKCPYGFSAECCSYNSKDEGFYHIYQLLVDEGVKNLGHRKIMLDAKYTLVGVSIQPHKKYGKNSVMNFK
jgi:uncharacterized protein YkwD